MTRPRRTTLIDYGRPGCYLITVVTATRRRSLGSFRGDTVEPTHLGRLAEQAWLTIPRVRPWVHVGAFVVMPDHVHGILWWDKAPGDRPCSTHLIINGFKGAVTRKAHSRSLVARDHVIWMRSYNVRVLATEVSRRRAERYVLDNARITLERWRARHQPRPVGRGWSDSDARSAGVISAHRAPGDVAH